MAGLLGAVLALFLTGVAQGQADRVLLFVDGRGEDLIRVSGKGRWVQDSGLVRVGTAALRIEPTGAEKYPGFTVSNIKTRGTRALVLSLFLEGDQKRTYRVALDDDRHDKAPDDMVITYETLSPGWNEVVVEIADRKTANGRPLQADPVLYGLQMTKSYEKGDPALVLDAVSARGGASAPERRKFLETLRADDPVTGLTARDRFKSVEDALNRKTEALSEMEFMPDQEIASLALDLLRHESYLPRFRRVAREKLSRISSPEVAIGVADAARSLPPHARYDVLWAVASMPCRQTRQRALGWVRDPKIPAAEKTALLNGLRLASAYDVRSLTGDLPPTTAWPVRAALVRALQAVPDPESVDALIGILGDPGYPRIAADAESALQALTGADYGTDAAVWRDWWRVNREKVALGATKAKGGQTRSYDSTFYGLPVPQGRIAFVIDTSGSMAEPVGGGKLGDYLKGASHLKTTRLEKRLDVAVAEVIHAISHMREKSAVAVIAFADDAAWMIGKRGEYEPVTAELRGKIAGRVLAMKAEQSTNMYAGLRAAFYPGGEPRPQDLSEGPDTIFLLSDGDPSEGKYKARKDLRDEILSWNLSRAIRINCVNVGDADANMLRDITSASGGVYIDLQSERVKEEPLK